MSDRPSDKGSTSGPRLAPGNPRVLKTSKGKMVRQTETRSPPVLDVRLGETRVGTITHLPYDKNIFVFDPDYGNGGGMQARDLSIFLLKIDLWAQKQGYTKVQRNLL